MNKKVETKAVNTMEVKEVEGFDPSSFNQENANSLMVVNEDTGMVAQLTSKKTTFCSLVATDLESKKILYTASNNPAKRVGDCINEVIKIKDIYCEEVTLVNETTGEPQVCPRIVLIDTDGVGYQAVSMGIFSAVKKLIQVFGVPTWDEGLAVKVRQITKGTNKINTLDIV